MRNENVLRAGSILPMTIDHVGVVHEIFRENFSLPWSEASLRQECRRPDGMTFVAIYEGEPIGFVNGTFLLQEANLNNIAVREAYKRQGVASALLCHFLDALAGRRIKRVYLEVRASNERATRLYERHGFLVVGRRKDCYAYPTEDAFIMSYVMTEQTSRSGSAGRSIP